MDQPKIRDVEVLPIVANKKIEDKRIELAQKEFAQEAKRLREKAGLSQEVLAQRMDIHQNTISRIEKANYGITLDVVLNYARYFHEDPYRLASIYWGDARGEISDLNKQVLDSIWEILSTHYLPKPPKELPPHKPRYSSPKLKGKTPKADKVFDEREQPEQDKGQDLPTENISESPENPDTETGED